MILSENNEVLSVFKLTHFTIIHVATFEEYICLAFTLIQQLCFHYFYSFVFISIYYSICFLFWVSV